MNTRRLGKELEARIKDIEIKNSVMERLKCAKTVVDEELLNLKKELMTSGNALESAQQKIKSLENSLQQTNLNVAKLEVTIQNLSKEAENRDKASTSHDTQDIETLYKASQDRENSYKQDLQALKARLDKVEIDYRKVQQENVDLRAKSNASNRNIQDLKSTYDRKDKEKESIRSYLKAVNNQLAILEVS